LAKRKVNIPQIKRETESLRQSKCFDLSKYCKYNWSQGHDTEDCWTFKNRLEKMFKSGQLPLPKVGQKPNNDRNTLGNHENIFIVEHRQKEWDPSMFIQDISSQKLRLNTPAPNIKVLGLQKSNQDDVYNLPTKASIDDFRVKHEEVDF